MILFEVFLRAKKKKNSFMFDQSNSFSRYEIKTNEPTKQRKACFKTGAYFVSQLLRTQDPSCLVVC